MNCLYCNEEFTPLTVMQKYCSAECGTRYRRENKGKSINPSISFSCAQCGKAVVTEEGSRDRRQRFCCRQCERKFWKHPHWDNPSTMKNFHSAEEYLSYERRTNEE